MSINIIFNEQLFVYGMKVKPASLQDAKTHIGQLCSTSASDLTLSIEGTTLTDQNLDALLQEGCTVHVKSAAHDFVLVAAHAAVEKLSMAAEPSENEKAKAKEPKTKKAKAAAENTDLPPDSPAEITPSISGTSGRIEVLNADPYMQLTQKFDDGLCGDSGRVRAISKSIIAENIRDIKAKEDHLRRRGEDVAADELQKCIDEVQEHSVTAALKIYSDIRKLALLLLEISDSVRTDITRIAPIQDELCRLLARVEKEAGISYKRFSERSDEINKRAKSIHEDHQWYSNSWTAGACLSGLCGSCTWGFHKLGMKSATALAQVPCVGHLLVKTSVANGFFGSSTTSAALMPGTSSLMCAGSTCCCMVAAGSLCASFKGYSRSREQRVLANAMIEGRKSAEFNKELWQGIHLLCTQARAILDEIPSHGGDRQRSWTEEMKSVGKMCLMNAQAIDILIISLEQCGFVPKNYNVAALLGDARYHKLKQSMNLSPAP